MGLNVLSCFDGISCGQVALERAGIEVDHYYASEIDKYAIKIAQKNYPNTIQLGDIRNWREWDLPKIDLIIAGSPCQGFSNAGLGLNFEDPRSKLFFTFCDLLAVYYGNNRDLKYLLENVSMKKEWRDIITDRMKVEPVMINSALVSAQNRKRLYWANWGFGQPEDKHIYLKDIIEDGEVDREKSYTIDANYYKGGNPRSYFEDGKRQLVFEHQSQKRAMVKIVGKTLIVPEATKKGFTEIGVNEGVDLTHPNSKTRRGRRMEDKCNAIVASMYKSDIGWWNGKEYRKLYTTECEALQTLPRDYTAGISNTQRYKCIGNGWTVDVIAHILHGVK